MKWGADEASLSFQNHAVLPGLLSVSSSLTTPWERLTSSKTLKVIIKGRELLTPCRNSKVFGLSFMLGNPLINLLL